MLWAPRPLLRGMLDELWADGLSSTPTSSTRDDTWALSSDSASQHSLSSRLGQDSPLDDIKAFGVEWKAQVVIGSAASCDFTSPPNQGNACFRIADIPGPGALCGKGLNCLPSSCGAEGEFGNYAGEGTEPAGRFADPYDEVLLPWAVGCRRIIASL